MKKITLFLIMLGFFLTASAQYNFAPIVGPTTIVSGATNPINLNDVANTAGAPASSSGSYDSFLVTVNWSAGPGIPWSSEADLTVTTSAGSVLIDPPTSGGASSGNATVLTFAGDFAGVYDPITDGFLDLVFDTSYGGSQINLSNIVVTIFESPTCPKPTGMIASNVASDTANLDWSIGFAETSWTIEYSSGADFTPGTGAEENSIDINGTPSTVLTGLTPATNYFMYYQANCGPGDLSLWVGPITFTTECVTFTAPYTEGFENGGTIPNCWSMSGGQDWFFSNTGAGNHIGNNGVITGNTATNNYFAWCDASGTFGPRTLTSPLVDISGLAVPALSFYELSHNEGNANSALDVEVWDGAAWNHMATYNTNTVGWEQKHIDLSTLTITGDVQVRFIFSEPVPNDFYDDIAIDDVTLDEAPSCFNPTMLAANAITSTGAELSWSQDGTVTSWNIEVLPTGTPPTQTPTESGVSNPHTLTGLNPVTTYDYYVQADCGPGDLSEWTGPFTFATLCAVFVPDYIQNFATIPADCWDVADNGTATTGPLELGTSSWRADGFLNNGSSGAYSINLWLNTKSDWLLSPLFDLTGGPFQVEFDFGVMRYGSTTQAGTLGSDDTVKFLMTNDNGLTWITLITYDNTSVFPPTGIHPVVDLTAYSGQTVQFGILASEGTINDSGIDVEVFVDNFRVRGIPTCPEPTDLTANSLSLTSTEVGWTENGTSTVWNIQYGPSGFNLGTGTFETDVTTNPYTLTGLTPDTAYDFYVQAACDPTDLSSYHGPFSFFTGYCESLPSSNDGTGVNKVTLGTVEFISPGDVTYENHTSPVVNVFRGLNTEIEIIFGHQFSHYTYIWVDFNDNLVFDPSELVFQGSSTPGGANPHMYDASFLMALTAATGEHRMRIVTSYGNQSTPNPCYNGIWGVTLDFTINVQELTCTLPEADYTVVPDCDNDQFYIDVNVTSIGDATSLEISNNYDTSTVQATATDVYQAGPFPFGSEVRIFVTNEQDNNCVIISQNFKVLACPPVNDDCMEATPAVVNTLSTCAEVTPGTILAATSSGVPSGSCTGNPDDDVWFVFEALDEVEIISITNITGGTTNLHHALYEGSCGSLTQLACTTSASMVTPLLTIGNTYYVRVFSGGSSPETSSFDLCIRPAPTNIICDTAENFCSVGGALTSPNIIGIPSSGQVACLFSIPNPAWNIIQIGEPGLIEIQISQVNENGNGIDVDFVLWGPFDSVTQACTDILLEDCPSCPNNTSNPNFYPFGNIVDCSYSAASIENLTIDNAQTGEIYMLLVTNYNGSAGTITIDQTNIGGTNNGTIEAEISAEIVTDDVILSETGTPNIVVGSACDSEFVILETYSPFADEYIWYKDGFEMAGETSSTLTVTESNNYQVRAIDNQCGSEADSQIVIINLYLQSDPIAPQTIEACEVANDGTAVFQLADLSASLGLGDGFTIRYFTTPGDANQAINAVSSPYTSSGEVLIMRIEDSNAVINEHLSCRQISQVELIVNPIPVINQPADFIVCDDIDGIVDGITEFDLTSIDPDVSTDTDLVMTYHTTQENADEGIEALASPYSSAGQTIYVRAEHAITGCYETTSFNIEVNVVPLATFDQQYDYQVCPNTTAPITIGLLPSNFTAADVTVTWTLDGNPISGSGITLETVLVEGDYAATITFNDTGCVNTVSATVIELDSCIFPEGISPGVSPGQNDSFDLSSFNVTKLKIFNRNGTLVYSKTNYTNEWVGQTNDGKELPVGTYFYTMEYEGGTKKRTAWVYINR